MGMRIGGQSNVSGTQGAGATQWQQRQQGVKDLMSALSSGDLNAAQKAFGSLPGAANLTASNSHADSPLAQIGKALQSGDLAAAQQAAQAWQAQRGGHHHHGGGQAGAPTGGTPQAGTTQAGTSGTGTVVNLTA